MARLEREQRAAGEGRRDAEEELAEGRRQQDALREALTAAEGAAERHGRQVRPGQGPSRSSLSGQTLNPQPHRTEPLVRPQSASLWYNRRRAGSPQLGAQALDRVVDRSSAHKSPTAVASTSRMQDVGYLLLMPPSIAQPSSPTVAPLPVGLINDEDHNAFAETVLVM